MDGMKEVCSTQSTQKKSKNKAKLARKAGVPQKTNWKYTSFQYHKVALYDEYIFVDENGSQQGD